MKKLTDLQKEILLEMGEDKKWYRPLDVGGHSRSGHSRAMASLWKKGFLERQNRHMEWGQGRPAWEYRKIAKGEEEAG